MHRPGRSRRVISGGFIERIERALRRSGESAHLQKNDELDLKDTKAIELAKLYAAKEEKKKRRMQR